MPYAQSTRVPVDRSKAQIEQTLMRYGADGFLYGVSAKGAGIGFSYRGRTIKFNIPLPGRDDYPETKSGEQKWEQEKRRLWRVLLLAIKAKLELVDSGLTSFEDEFLAQTCLPQGQTVSELLQPQIDKYLQGGKLPKLLSAGVVPDGD